MHVGFRVAKQDTRGKSVVGKTVADICIQEFGGLRKSSTLLPQPLQRALGIRSSPKTSCAGPEAARGCLMRKQVKQLLDMFLPWEGTRLQNTFSKDFSSMSRRFSAGFSFVRSPRLRLRTPSLMSHGTFRERVRLIAPHPPTLVIAFCASAFAHFQGALAQIKLETVRAVLAIARGTSRRYHNLKSVLLDLLRLPAALALPKCGSFRRERGPRNMRAFPWRQPVRFLRRGYQR